MTVQKLAHISPCGLYRYWLSRQWDLTIPPLLIVMLNPSIADAEIDDPTIRRCIAFARANGFGGIVVVNLFAYRATEPASLRTVVDPIGPENDARIRTLFEDAIEMKLPVLAAWGAHGGFQNRDTEVRLMALELGVELVCLGTTKSGQPRHPLYVSGDQPFVPFN